MSEDRLPTPDITPIHRLIRTTRRLLRSSWVGTGAGLTVGLLLGTLLLAAAVDIVFPMAEWLRWVALGIVALPASYALLIGVLLPLVRRLAPGDVARRIESRLPGIHNRLVSCIDLSDHHQPGFSPAFYRKLVTEALDRIRSFQPRMIIDFLSLRRAVLFATGSAVAFILTWCLLSDRMPTAVARIFAPWADIPPASDVAYTVQPGNFSVLRGEEVPLEVHVSKGEPKELRVELNSDAAAKPLRYDLKAEKSGLWKLTLDSSSIGDGFENGFSYRVYGGGTWSKKYQVTMVDRPVLVSLNTVLHYPAYLQIPETRPGNPQVANVSGPAGSTVEVIVQAKDNDVKEAEIQFLDRVWFDDKLPAGAQMEGSWSWDRKFHGKIAHTEPAADGTHQHWFQSATQGFVVQSGESLFAYVYLVPEHLPEAIMLQWHDGTDWEHRAYWGADAIKLHGRGDTPGHRHMGPLPAAGGWVRLEVPAAKVGLEGKTLRGMSFTLSGGQAYWHRAGTAPASGPRTYAMTPLGDNRWSGRFPLKHSGSYRVELRNNLGHANQAMQDATFEALPDLPPQIRVDKPGNVDLSEVQKLPLDVAAFDDYGLAKVVLRLHRGDFGSPVKEMILAKHEGPRKLKDGDPRDDRRVLTTLDLTDLQLKPGETVRYVIEVHDRKKQVTRSPEYLIRITTDKSGDDQKLAAFEKLQDPFYDKLLALIAEQAKVKAEVERLVAKYAPLAEKLKEAEAKAALDAPKNVNPGAPNDPKTATPPLDPETAKMLDALRKELADLAKLEQKNLEAGKALDADLAKSAEQAENMPLMPRPVADEMRALERAFQQAALQPLQNLLNQMQQGADPKQAAPNIGDLQNLGDRVQRDLEAMRDRMKALADIRQSLRKEDMDKVLDRMRSEMVRQNARLNAGELEELLKNLQAMRQNLDQLRGQQGDLRAATEKPDANLPDLTQKQDQFDKNADKALDDTRNLQARERMGRMKRKKDFPDAPYTPEGEEKKEKPTEQDTNDPLPGKDKDKKDGPTGKSDKGPDGETKKTPEEEDFKPVLPGARTKMDERYKDRVRPVEKKDSDKGDPTKGDPNKGDPNKGDPNKGNPAKGDPQAQREGLQARQDRRMNELNRAADSLAADEDALGQMLDQLKQALQAGQKGKLGQPGQQPNGQPDDALAQMMQSQMMQQAMALAQRMRQVRSQAGQRNNNPAHASTGNMNGGQSPGGNITEADLAKLTLEQRSVLLKMQPALREELLQGMREDVPEGYRKFTQEYFKRLTEVKNQKP